MIIRSNQITKTDIERAAAVSGTRLLRLSDMRRPKARYTYVWEVRLGGSSKYAPTNMPGEKTATYDEWGNFLAYLYKIDKHMSAGIYRNANQFHVTTEGRFGV